MISSLTIYLLAFRFDLVLTGGNRGLEREITTQRIMEVRERETRNHNNPPQSNQESSPMFSYAAALNSSRNETPDQLRLHLHQRNNYHGLELQEEQMEAHRRRSESNPDPDPDPVSQTLPPPSPSPPQPSATDSDVAAVVVRYRECLKNHAASMGSHVLDGCGEFMANGEQGTPEGLKCAACECHRSFHRREVEGESQSTTTRIPVIHNPPPRAVAMQPIPASSSHQQHHRYHHQMPPFMVAFGGGNSVAPTESSSEDLDAFRTHGGGHMMEQPSKKRFRTKFTEEQKEKMQDFAERIGWKIQKQDEQEIRHFCNEVGLKRQVFKVWMHNSKQAMKKKQV